MTQKKTDDAATTNATAGEGAPAVDTSARHYAAQDFNDAGTEREFKRGDALTDVDDGTLINYAAAGLATTDKPKTSA